MVKLIKLIMFCIKFYKTIDIQELSSEYKTKLRNEDAVWEKTINEILLYNLSKRMMRDEISFDFVSGFKTALLLRNSLKSLSVEKGIDK